MESKIKWQTGEPYESGTYLVTMKDGTVSIRDWYNSYTGCKYWVWSIEDNPIVAWCKLSDIEPLKNRSMENRTNPVTNKELQDLLKQYPDDAIVAIEYCDIRKLQYFEERNLIEID